MLMLYSVVLIGRINSNINIADMPITGILSNLGYLILLIMANETNVLSINAKYGLNNPLRYNVAITNEIPGIGNPMNPFISILSAITLYLVNLKTPQTTINKLTSITIVCKMPEVVLMQQ